MSEERSQQGISRRGFLKTTAAIVGAAGAGGAAQLAFAADKTPYNADEQTFIGACRGNCMGTCPIEVTVRDGKVVRTTAADVPESHIAYKRICQRGRTHLQLMYNEKRLLYPLRRKEGTPRGGGQWERISWDEAVNEICTKWKSYRAQYGPGSVCVSNASGNYGWAFGNYVSVAYVTKFMNVLDARNAMHLYDSGLGAYAYANSGALNCQTHTLLSSKAIVVWGSNPTEASPHVWHFIIEAKQAGARLVCIDPNFTITASRADRWIPIRPGTDGAMELAICKAIYERGLMDEATVKNQSTLPFLVKPHNQGFVRISDVRELAEGEYDSEVVMGTNGVAGAPWEVPDCVLTGVYEVNGVQCKTVFENVLERLQSWTYEKATRVTGVSAEDMDYIIDTYVNHSPAATVFGLGLDHYNNVRLTYGNMALVVTFSGNLKFPGGGMDVYYTPSVPFSFPPIPFTNSTPSISAAVPIQKIEDIMNRGEYFGEKLTIKSIMFNYHNLLANTVDRNSVVRGLDKVDLIIVSDMVMTETAAYADIVLPCAHFFEEKDICKLYSPFVILNERAVNPPAEAKSNFEIFQAIGRGMGFTADFQETEEQYLRAILESDSLRAAGITWDRLHKEKVIGTDLTDPGTCIAAPDGRLNFYYGLDGGRAFTVPNYGGRWSDADLDGVVDEELESFPTWYPPHEAWAETIDEFPAKDPAKKYPLLFTTYRNKFRCHTMFGYNPWLLEIWPEPFAWISPKELEKRGIKDGDYIRAYNDRGEMVVKVFANEGIREGMVVVPKGWQADQFIKGHYSALTSRWMNPVSSVAAYFDSLCEIEKYEGSVE